VGGHLRSFIVEASKWSWNK